MKKGNMTLGELVEKYVRSGMPRHKAVEKAYNMWLEGKLRLRDPSPPRDFLEYLSRPDYSAWLWASALLLALTLIAVGFSWLAKPILYARYVLGTLFVLYMPGMALIEALYPREEELSPLERLALSIGLSLAVVPLIGLVLNYTPWGIRLNPILASLTLYTAAMLTLAAYRKYQEAAKGNKLEEG